MILNATRQPGSINWGDNPVEFHAECQHCGGGIDDEGDIGGEYDGKYWCYLKKCLAAYEVVVNEF